jgi:hypothetical protein
LKLGPMIPDGRLPRMSPTFLRTWYQSSFTLAGGVRSERLTRMNDTPGRE